MRVSPQSLAARATFTFLKGLFGLPDWALRLLGGTAIVVDGQTLAPASQLMNTVQRCAPVAIPRSDAGLHSLRRLVDIVGQVFAAGVAASVPSRDVLLPCSHRTIGCRLYEPVGLPERAPGLVYFHGGGFVLGSVGSHDGICRYLAEQAKVRVVSVDYRLAPEHPFPAAVDDAIGAFGAIVEQAGDFGIDAGAIAVGGDSAGANLAAVVCHAACRGQVPSPAHALFLYPVTDVRQTRRSHALFGSGFMLDERLLAWFRDQYLPDYRDYHDRRVSILAETAFGEFPPSQIITAGFDALRDDGEAYARRLREAGVPVTHQHREGLRHGFANQLGIDREANAAMHHVATTFAQSVTARRFPWTAAVHDRPKTHLAQ